LGNVSLTNRSAQLSAIWSEEGQSLQADVAVQMQRLTLDIVGMVAFSHNFGQVDAMQKLGATAGENEIPTDRILHDINVAQVCASRRSRPIRFAAASLSRPVCSLKLPWKIALLCVNPTWRWGKRGNESECRVRLCVRDVIAPVVGVLLIGCTPRWADDHTKRLRRCGGREN